MIDIATNNGILSLLINNVIYKDPERKEIYLQAINNEHGKGTSNSKHTFEWDLRYNNVYEAANNLNLLPLKVSRSNLWEVMFVINVETKEIFAFMKEKTLKEVMNSDGQHYSKLLNQFNVIYDYLPPIDQQTSLFPSNESIDKEKLLNLAKEMISSSAIVPEKFFIFAFDDSSINTTIRALAFNTNNELIFERSLSNLLTTDYTTILENDSIFTKKVVSKSPMIFAREGTKKKPLVKLKVK